jgi:hypothetical protein
MMKKNALFITALFLNINSLFAQMDDGIHIYENNLFKVEMAISNGGQNIASAKITDKETNKTSIGSGIYRNNGDMYWYELQTNECNYDFNEPKQDVMLLNRFDCKTGAQNTSIKLMKIPSDDAAAAPVELSLAIGKYIYTCNQSKTKYYIEVLAGNKFNAIYEECEVQELVRGKFTIDSYNRTVTFEAAGKNGFKFSNTYNISENKLIPKGYTHFLACAVCENGTYIKY